MTIAAVRNPVDLTLTGDDAGWTVGPLLADTVNSLGTLLADIVPALGALFANLINALRPLVAGTVDALDTLFTNALRALCALRTPIFALCTLLAPVGALGASLADVVGPLRALFAHVGPAFDRLLAVCALGARLCAALSLLCLGTAVLAAVVARRRSGGRSNRQRCDAGGEKHLDHDKNSLIRRNQRS